MDPIVVRNVGPADASVLAGLVAAFRDHLLETEPSEAQIASQLPRALRDPCLEFACAWLAGRAIGYSQTRFLTSVWVPGCEAHLEDLFVVPEARRSGAGRHLLRHVLARARGRAALRVSLNTNEENLAAHALYRSEGFAPQTHSLYPDGREVQWSRRIRGT